MGERGWLDLFLAALNAAVNGIVITDTSGTILWVNRAMEMMSGYAAEAICGKNTRIFKNLNQDPALYLNLWTTIVAGGTWHGELVNQRRDGSSYDVAITITPIKNDDGIVTHYVAVKEDVTARNVAATALKRSNEQLEQAVKMEALGLLAGGVAHDFNNLLSIILSYADLLRQSRTPDELEALSDIDQISAAAKRAAELTRQLLAFSRRQVLLPEATDLGELVQGFAKMLDRLLGEDITFHFTTSPGLWTVRVDRSQIEQVILNLCVNARDAMPHGGVIEMTTVNIELQIEAAATLSLVPGPYVLLRVRDTGVGMDEAVRARVFEPFFTTKPLGKGTGLGLSMVYGIVKQSRGAISVESKVGGGTTFRIYLPMHMGVEPLSPSRKISIDWLKVRGNETILVVEDDLHVRTMVQRSLVNLGYTCLLARDVHDALNIAMHRGPHIDLILTDVVMPEMSGMPFAELALPHCPKAKLLFMSGYTPDTPALEEHGVLESDFLPKPFSWRDLAIKVRAVLDGIKPSE